MALVGRGAQMAVLQSALSECLSGKAAIVLVEGAAGCGKSEIIERLAEEADRAGARVLRAVGSPKEKDLPLGALRQLVGGVPSGALPLPPLSHSDEVVRIGAMQTFSVALYQLSVTTPVVLCVDDVQHLDEATCQYLLHVARGARSRSVLLLLTESLHDRAGNPAFGTELLRLPHFRRVRLERLDREAVGQFAAAQRRLPTDGALPDQLYTLSGGNPLLLRALVEEYRTTAGLAARASGMMGGQPTWTGDGCGVAVRRAARPATSFVCEPDGPFAQAVLTCLRRGGAATVELAKVLAVLGDQASPELTARLLASSTAGVTAGVTALDHAGITDGCRFRDAAVRDAVLTGVPSQERHSLHRRAAELLYASGALPAVIARHLLAARHGGERWMATVLREAAEQAIAEDDVSHATACLVLAYETSGDAADRTAISIRLAAVTWRSNPAAAEHHLTHPLAELRAERLPVTQMGPLARALVAQGRVDEAADVLDQLSTASADAGPRAARDGGGSPLAALFASSPPQGAQPQGAQGAVSQDGAPAVALPEMSNAHCSAALWTVPGAQNTSAAPREAGRRAPQRTGTLTPIRPMGSPAPDKAPDLTEAEVCTASAPCAPVEESSTASAERFLRSATVSYGTLEPIVQALRTLVYGDRPDRALPWGQALLDEAQRCEAPGWQAMFATYQAEALLLLGNLEGARDHARLALERLPEGAGSVFGCAPTATLISALTAMGRHAEAARLLGRPVPDGLFTNVHGLAYLRARGHHYLATSRSHAALADFLDVGRMVKRWGLDRPVLVPWRTDAAEALLQLGEPQQADRLVTEQLAGADARHPRIRGMSLRLRAATSGPRQRPRLLSEAVDELRRYGDRLELSRAMADLGQALADLGERARASMVTRRAWHLARECRAESLRERILPGHMGAGYSQDAPLRATGREEEAGLSDSEKRVAVLAAYGHTNREIALKLYITVSTVEQHLTRVYRKLNITRRQELPMDLQLGTVEIA